MNKILKNLKYCILNFHIQSIKKLARQFAYTSIDAAHDRGYIANYVQLCQKYIRASNHVLEFDGFITYGGKYHNNVKLARSLDQKAQYPDCDFYFDLTDQHTLPKVKFDCIIATNVLCHVLDCKEALTNLKEMLNPNGILILTMPGLVYQDGGAVISGYTSYGITLLCKSIFHNVFQLKRYGDFKHAVFSLTGCQRQQGEKVLSRSKDNIVIITGLCCRKEDKKNEGNL